LKIKLGIIGCGMRGKWIADLFVKHGGYQFVGAADYFQERVDEFGEACFNGGDVWNSWNPAER
jgi:predicted dehydrogenase